MEHHSAVNINKLSSRENTRRNLKCILLSESRESEKATYYMIPTIRHSGKGKMVERSVVPRVWRGEGRDVQVEHRWVLGQWDYSLWYSNGGYMTLCICQSPENVQHRVSPNVSQGLSLIIMYFLFPNFNKCTTLMHDINHRQTVAWEECGKEEIHMEALYFLISFFVNLKLF